MAVLRAIFVLFNSNTMRLVRYLSLFCLLPFFCFACWPSDERRSLREIENIIQISPDTALMKLRQLPKEDFKLFHDLGLYSLLYSMALDKNYIDICSDSLIRPAVRYYSKHGDRYHKFLTYYYLGRVQENGENYDDALKSFVKAEENIGVSTPAEYVVRLHSRKGRVYVHQLANDMALIEGRKAMAVSVSLDNPAYFIRNCLDVASLLSQANRNEESKDILDSLNRWCSRNKVVLPSSYYKSLIDSRQFNPSFPDDSINDLYASYLLCCSNENIVPDALLAAQVLIRQGKFSDAETIFNSVRLSPYDSHFDSIAYYATAMRLFRGVKDIDNYSFTSDEYHRLVENMYLDIFKRDVRFVEERYANERREETDRRKKTYLVLFIIVLTATLIASTLIYKKRHAQLVREFNEATADYSLLKRIVASADDSKQDIKNALETRIRALTPYFQERKTPRLGRDDIKKLKRDNKEMLRNIGLLYSLSFPEFVSALLQYGLSSEEIGLCSLYASGFLSKEVSSIIDSGSIYHINRSIRTKLGDVVDARALPSWLRDLFER